MKQTLKIGAVVLAVAALAMTGVAVAQSDAEGSVFEAATLEDSPLRSKIVEWLAPLIDEGTIDQGQAEAVADTLAERLPPAPRVAVARGLEAVRQAADFLGLAPQEIVAAVRDGQTLAQIAVAQGSTAAALVDHLVGAVEEHLSARVADGRITEEQKADMLEHATERITDLVNGEIDRPLMGGPGMGRGHGRGMGGFGGGPCSDGDAGSQDLGA